MLESMTTRNRPGRRKRRKLRKRQVEMNLIKGRGGPGRGQGRPKRRFDYVPHTKRPFIDERLPVHVSTRVLAGLPSLRGRKLWAAVRKAFVFGCDKGRFRIVHFSVQGMHLHLICEAKNRRELSRGIQGFKIRVSKAINRACGRRKGKVFVERYHERIITNPTQCRHTLAYVLLNARPRERRGCDIPAEPDRPVLVSSLPSRMDNRAAAGVGAGASRGGKRPAGSEEGGNLALARGMEARRRVDLA